MTVLLRLVGATVLVVGPLLGVMALTMGNSGNDTAVGLSAIVSGLIFGSLLLVIAMIAEKIDSIELTLRQAVQKQSSESSAQAAVAGAPRIFS